MKQVFLKKPLPVIALFICMSGVLQSCGDASKPATAGAEVAATTKTVKVAEVLKTDYFDVTVNSFKKVKSIPDADVKAEEGSVYLILDITFKNTDKESRMMTNGVLVINANGQDYKYESPEMVLADGYGIIMDDINPLMTKRTKIVYKVPAELAGTAYFKPARADDDEQIVLGATN